MVNTGKKLPYIAFQYPRRAGMVFTNSIRKGLKPTHRLMNAFFVSARERLASKSLVEKWIKQLIDGVMQDPIPHRRFVYLAGLRVGDGKHMIASMLIRSVLQVDVETDNVIEKMQGKLLDILLFGFAQNEVSPSRK